MEDIGLIIKVPEEVYRAYKMDSSLSLLSADQKSIAECYLTNGLINGTLLPKGYGRLIDADVLNKIRAEIEALPRELPTDNRNMIRKTRVLDIIDKYRGEKE